MTYVGRGVDAISNVEKLDNITFNGGTTYNLTKSSAAFTPAGKNNILISINGVIQQGNFTVAAATIVFDFSPTSNDTCNFIMHYGTGVLNTPADDTVKTATVQDNAITLAKMASGTDGNIISYDASGNPVAIATGNDGQVLTSTGAGSPPAFESISAGTSLTGSTNNQVTTVTGANAIQGETNLIYDGTILGAGAAGASADLGTGLHVKEADSSGSVNSTYASLVIEGSGSCGMQFLGGTSGNQEIRFGDSGSNSIGWIKYDNDDNSMNFRVNEATAMHIASNAYIKAIGVYNQSAGDSANVVIDGSGNLYRSTSALKYKQDVRDLESIDISSFRPVRYKSKSPKDDPNKDFLGFIADEFHDAGLTELVSYNISYAEDDTKKENPIYEVEGFNYDRLTAILTKSLQEANEKIKILETKVAALESA